MGLSGAAPATRKISSGIRKKTSLDNSGIYVCRPAWTCGECPVNFHTGHFRCESWWATSLPEKKLWPCVERDAARFGTSRRSKALRTRLEKASQSCERRHRMMPLGPLTLGKTIPAGDLRAAASLSLSLSLTHTRLETTESKDHFRRLWIPDECLLTPG